MAGRISTKAGFVVFSPATLFPAAAVTQPLDFSVTQKFVFLYPNLRYTKYPAAVSMALGEKALVPSCNYVILHVAGEVIKPNPPARPF